MIVSFTVAMAKTGLSFDDPQGYLCRMVKSLSIFFKALRPEAFLITIYAIWIIAASLQISLLSAQVFRTIFVICFAHAGANTINSYFDYINGVDNQYSADLTLVNKIIEPWEMLALSISCYGISFVLFIPSLLESQDSQLLLSYLSGVALSMAYSVNPINLRYKALGDISIFLCFGPLLTTFTSLMLTGSIQQSISLFSIPSGLFTESIIHAKNIRDIRANMVTGAITLASVLGETLSIYLYFFFLSSTYAVVITIVYYFHYGCALTLLTIPICIKTMNKVFAHNISDLALDTLILYLPFGLLFIIGLYTTDCGLQEILENPSSRSLI